MTPSLWTDGIYHLRRWHTACAGAVKVVKAGRHVVSSSVGGSARYRPSEVMEMPTSCILRPTTTLSDPAPTDTCETTPTTLR
jgi:hypothetical protein